MKTYFELVTDMSKSDLQELESRLTVLIEHLLKLAHVTGQAPRDNFRGWNQTVRNQRRDLAAHIKANPGLKSKLTEELLDDIYRVALAKSKTEFRGAAFPSARRLSLDEIVRPEVVLALE